MPKFVAHIANCWLKGYEWSDTPSGRIRNRISLTLDGFRMALVRTPESFAQNVGDMKGLQVHTSDLEFENVIHSNVSKAKEIAVGVAELLSFGLLSQVTVFGFSCDDGTRQMFAVRGKLLYFRPVFGPALGAEIKSFLEMTYPSFRRLRARRKLHVIFDYLTTAELPDQPIEVKFLLAIVALESLKSSFARERKIPFHAGAFRRLSSPPKANLAREPKYKFSELVAMMCKAVGMSPRTRRIITLRNQIVHFGMSRRPADSLTDSYYYTQDILREYLLRLMNFQGSFHSYRKLGIHLSI